MGLLAREISLTDRQAIFVRAVLGGAERTTAARIAGYGEPEAQGWRLSRTPSVAAAIDLELRCRLATEAAPVAIRFLMEVVRNDGPVKFGERVRVDAAKTLLDRAGYVAPRQAVDTLGKPVEDMSPDELRVFIRSAELALGDKATVVGSQPLGTVLGDML